MIELYEELKTCDDVRTLGQRNIGEGPTMDYKEKLAFTERGALTRGAKKDLAKDVSALANAQGGLLIIGVKDPDWEGGAPVPDDFVGLAVGASFARDLESVLLAGISPSVYPLVRVTEDDFEDPESKERRRFVIIGVRRSSRLLQATTPEDFRFYRRAVYQNRVMDVEEVRLRMIAEDTASAEVERAVEEESARIGPIFNGGPRVAFLAFPTAPHRFAVEPATSEARQALDMYIGRQPPQHMPSQIPEILSPGLDCTKMFLPAGDGARYFYRRLGGDITAEVRVRRDGSITSARNYVEIYSDDNELLWLRRPGPSDAVLVVISDEERGVYSRDAAVQLARAGHPSTILEFLVAVRFDPSMLLSSARGFLRFVHETHAFLGYPGPVRVEALVSGGGSYLAVAAPPIGQRPRFYYTSEYTEVRSSVEVEHEDLAAREGDVAEEILTRLAWHFGLEAMQSPGRV